MANIEKISSVVQNEKIVEKINELADGVNSSLKEAPVLSVNGQTGTVNITSVTNATNATNATKATQDGNGNNIVNTYATKEEIATKANTDDVVLKSGDQEITGRKTFNGRVVIPTEETNPDSALLIESNSGAHRMSMGYGSGGFIITSTDSDGILFTTKLTTFGDIDARHSTIYGKNGKEVAYNSDLTALQDTVDIHIANKYNPHSVTKTQVGLGNVDNTSDLDKPVSTAQSVAIADAKKAGTDALDVANSKYEKPNDGIPKADLDVGVQASLSKADTALQKAPVTSVNGATGDVQIDVPTKLSELTNDKGFITATVNNLTNYYAKTLTYTKTEVDNLLSAIPKFGVSVVDSLPTTGISSTTVYLIPNTAPDDSNLYDEYIYVLGKWEKLGTAKIDLSNYVTVTQLNSTLASYATKTEVGAKYTKPSTGIPKSDLASAVQTSLNKADTALQSFTESDPTVPAWAKQQNKPSYTKSEVGLGNVANERQYSANNPPPYPVTSVNGEKGAVQITAANIGALTSIPLSTATAIGGVKSSTTGTTSGRDYKVQVNTDGTMKVNVPWTDTNTTYSFSNGSDGSFTVTPSGGQAQKVSIGTPAAATKATTANNALNLGGKAASEYLTSKSVSNPNLLINSNFAINQRRITNTTNAYFYDRWYANGAVNATPITGGIQFTSTVSWNGVQQQIEVNKGFANKKLTFSFDLAITGGDVPTFFVQVARTRSGTRTAIVEKYIDGTSISTRYSITGTVMSDILDTDTIMVIIWSRYANQTISISNTKLEFGDTATEYIPPDPATELLRCRRYFGDYSIHFGSVYDSTGGKNYGIGYSTFDTPMRVTPTLTLRTSGKNNMIKDLTTGSHVQGGCSAEEKYGFEVYASYGYSGYRKFGAHVLADAEIY